ncbi:MAG: aspartate-semialdehyde dehydrogenase [bacterium]|nr:aspartate-semialdehyde dehydrogenase [bacterium]
MVEKYKIAVFGATGLTGRTFLRICEENSIPYENIDVFASENSKDLLIPYLGEKLKVRTISQLGKQYDFIFGFCSNAVTKQYQDLWLQHSKIVIDNSSAFRLQQDVPLIVPEVNIETFNHSKRWISNPNCSTIQLVRVLHRLRSLGIVTIHIATYQSVSGAGRLAMFEWENQKVGKDLYQLFPEIVHQNVIPRIGEIDKTDGFTVEEKKLIRETQKILNCQMCIIPTCVRVPVEVGHSEAVTIHFSSPVEKHSIVQLLSSDLDIEVRDEYNSQKVPTPKDVAGTDKILVGRIRVHPTEPTIVSLWIVADNLRVGAATNAFRIFQKIGSIDGLDPFYRNKERIF